MTTVSRLRTRRRIFTLTLVAAVAAAFTGLAGGQATAPRPATAPARPATAAAPTAANRAAAAAHFQKAKDLYEAKKYHEAMPENDQALLLDPALMDAQVLRRVLIAKLAEVPGGENPIIGPIGPLVRPKNLTMQQVSTIRLMEAPLDDASIKGTIPRKALEDFWTTVWTKKPGVDLSQEARNTFFRPDNFPAQVQAIRDSSNPDFIRQVTVTTDPANLITYTNMVHTFVLQNCATADCHGGDKGGTFRLIGAGNSPEIRYTNFYIMSMYKSGGGAMLDRNTPDDSLLLQYALPKNLAKLPHPKIEPRKLGATTDPRYRQISDWIRSLSLPMPNYGISFDLPGTVPASAPAGTSTAPATTGTARPR